MKALRFLLISFLFVLLAACQHEVNNDADMTPPPAPASSFNQTASPKTGEPRAIMKTTMGTIKIRLFSEQAPETVKNFTELAKKGFYDGLIFHRVIPDFMIQGGDPLGNGTGGESYKGPGTTIPDEFSSDLRHIKGALSMANRGPDTGTSQFFIVQAAEGTPWLDGKHAIFGQVYEGMNVVDAIAKVETNERDMPKKSVKIEKVTIE